MGVCCYIKRKLELTEKQKKRLAYEIENYIGKNIHLRKRMINRMLRKYNSLMEKFDMYNKMLEKEQDRKIRSDKK